MNIPLPEYPLVILRHGESEWNKLNLFTGWRDVRLTDQGEQEARQAGHLMAAARLGFDLAYTSLLSRAIHTLWLSLGVMDLMWIPETKDWRLNERHYGALQGRNKAEAVEEFGAAQVKEWRRSYATPPPPVSRNSPDFPANDPRYAAVDPAALPRSESLEDVLARVVPYWSNVIMPQLAAGKRVLIVAHGNSLRALMKHLEDIGDEAIADVNLPTGVPRVYRFDSSWKAIEARFLGDPAEIEAKVQSVQNQTRQA